MSEHYFSKKPQSKSSPKKWRYSLRGREYTFLSDYGVFSKNEVDFGSRLLAENFKAPPIMGDFLDLGCGYGPIGISMADNFRDRRVVLADVNERAVLLAEENAAVNHVSNIEIVQSDRLANLEGWRFAAIVTNPPIRAGKTIVHSMFEDSHASLLKGGRLWVVIQKKQGAPSAKAKLESLFGNVEVIAKSKGYFLFVSVKQ
ncbi:class I SAM-dependent methyltransferase [Virgibacillus siamensis]|uniref:Class I SAM-dependent methyltransferase n=1 Tax=Virgibacillus siamensis TaxID=480071 RepID=A0ABN1FSH8_9BACI